MDHLPHNDIQNFWNDTKEKTWLSFRKTLERRVDHATGNDTYSVRLIIHMAGDMENSGEPFPRGIDEMYNLINENLGLEDKER